MKSLCTSIVVWKPYTTVVQKREPNEFTIHSLQRPRADWFERIINGMTAVDERIFVALFHLLFTHVKVVRKSE